MQIFASVKSRSLAIVASTLESLLDLLAGVILLFTRWTMQQENKYKYPIGKLRVQPVGIVIFAAIMAALGKIHKPLLFATGLQNSLKDLE